MIHNICILKIYWKKTTLIWGLTICNSFQFIYYLLFVITQFEWAWQNPRKSRRLRHVANKTSKEKGIDFCFRVLSAMLNVGPWNRLPLTIRWLKQEYKMEFDVEQLPPKHMPIVYGPLNKRKPKKGNNGGNVEVEEANNTSYRCVECSKKIKVYNANFSLFWHCNQWQ